MGRWDGCRLVGVLMLLFAAAVSGKEVVRREREGRPLLEWHPMKAGGTSFCMMARDNEFSEMHNKLYGFSWGINCKVGRREQKAYHESEMLEQIPNMTALATTYYRFPAPITKKGIRLMTTKFERHMVAYEPGYPGGQRWGRYNPRALLSNDFVWREYYHIFLLRHPVERVFSHLRFEPVWRKCVTEDRFEEIINSVLDGTCYDMCLTKVCDWTRYQIDGYLVRHLSGNPANLSEAAYHMLFHIDHAVDVTEYPILTESVMRNALGWKDVPEAHAREVHSEADKSYEETYPDLYQRLRTFVAEDLELYELGMEKARLWCEQVEDCEWDGDDFAREPDAAARRKTAYEKWTKFFKDA